MLLLILTQLPTIRCSCCFLSDKFRKQVTCPVATPVKRGHLLSPFVYCVEVNKREFCVMHVNVWGFIAFAPRNGRAFLEIIAPIMSKTCGW